tara:strand:- start:35 stop:634 length:600 start_codon:yes stop_codon:yes gene_type:complete
MKKIKEILIGTNNKGKYREICDLLPKNIKKYSPKNFKLKTPSEDGKSFEENAMIKAIYFSKKTNMICLSDDSGLQINLLKGSPGIYSARWGGKENDFNYAIKKVYTEMSKAKRNWQRYSLAQFVCCLAIYTPDNKAYLSKGIIQGTISDKIKGKNGFGYDPIFIPKGHKKTFSEMEYKTKLSIDHRYKAYQKIKKLFVQ